MVLGRSQPGVWTSYREQAETIAASLPPLLVEAERVAATVAQGVHGRRKVGVGETFWEYRHHRAQDPMTAIDWRQSAKSDNLFVRENEWEAAESVWLWRDNSPSMHYGSDFAAATKLDRATVLSLACASLLIRGGERIARLEANDPPAAGKSALRRYASDLVNDTESDQSLPSLIPLPRFAQVVMISDFFTPAADIEIVMRFYASGGIKGHLVQIMDPAEEELPFEGRARFEGLEGESDLTFDRVEALRDQYRGRVNEHRAAIAAAAQRLGWSFMTHRTDKPPQTALLALYASLSGEIANTSWNRV